LLSNEVARITAERSSKIQSREVASDLALDAFEGVFCSPEMARVYEIAKTVAGTDVPVLLTGESGVGKDVLTRFIHRNSKRAKQTLVRVNCATLPNDLLESELFGYERGAFTGAMVEKPGKFELANGGTIFLDEIAEMSPHLQAKLLHVLQDGEYCRLGGRGSLRVDARTIASTNRRLEEAVSRGEFREDLYFRLNVIRIQIPPLRERKEELGMLSNHFVAKYGEKYGSTVRQLPADVLKAFMDYDWPGNIRELENVIKRYLILPNMGIAMAGIRPQQLANAGTTSNTQVQAIAASQVPPLPPSPPQFSSLKQAGLLAAENAEREIVMSMLDQTNWNRKQAARRLNVCYKALLNKIKKWQIQPPPSQTSQSSLRKNKVNSTPHDVSPFVHDVECLEEVKFVAN
jgi:two-component system response regulator AtoC